MKSYFGAYRFSAGAEPAEATVLVFDKNLNIGYKDSTGGNTTVNWDLKDIYADFEFASQQTKLRNNRFAGVELCIQGADASNFVKQLQASMQLPWHKKSRGKELIRNSLLLLGILGLLFLLYLLIVPWLSEKLASKVSVKTEQQLGDAVYDAMGLAAQEDKEAGMIINSFFDEMKVETPYNIRISVVKGSVVNAFALPGGRIVVYDALLKQMRSYPELAALLSHEFTHVNNKHSTKSIFRRLGSRVFIGLLFGRFGSVTSVLINHADDLKSLKYSRSLEKEADTDGLKLLMQRKIDPQGFVELFTHLKESTPSSAMPEFLGSHPDIDKRIAYIREESKNAPVAVDSTLKAIFEKLN